ncbi:hypothetical protein AXG93_1913s1030 [Marchantia polymorpha subsp. ruderalis]|uniref:Uncharacterized protein n=1 Tax=Marchantia polymorpha subsp. ruderalis TaxID=1480154 RepID=A0A176WL22_MARPO|nr:hypothetical protein AXG93_1913s1030 [Marchantia polymorpha subsp. ruderalis]
MFGSVWRMQADFKRIPNSPVPLVGPHTSRTGTVIGRAAIEVARRRRAVVFPGRSVTDRRQPLAVGLVEQDKCKLLEFHRDIRWLPPALLRPIQIAPGKPYLSPVAGTSVAIPLVDILSEALVPYPPCSKLDSPIQPRLDTVAGRDFDAMWVRFLLVELFVVWQGEAGASSRTSHQALAVGSTLNSSTRELSWA